MVTPVILTQTLLLLIGCSLAWAAFDLLRKVLTPHLTPLLQVFYLTLGLVPVLSLWAWSAGGSAPTGLYALVCAGSILLNVAANIAYVKALEVSDLSLSVPLLSLTPAVSAAFAVILLGEHLSGLQVTGILLVIAGALLLTTEQAPGHSIRGWLQALRHDRGSAFMLLVAVCWSLTLPLDKIAVLAVGPSRHAAISTAGVAIATFAILVVTGQGRSVLRPPRGAWLPLAVAVLVSAAAFGLQLVLLEQLEVGIIDGVKRAIGNVMALVFGALIYRESVTLTKGAALAIMAAGVLLILA